MDKNIDTFDLYPHDDDLEKIRNNYLYNLLSLSLKLDELEKFKNCQCPQNFTITPELRQSSVNIKKIIDKFNRIMKILSDLFNNYAKSLNYLDTLEFNFPKFNFSKFNLKYVVHEPIELKSYDVPVSKELIDFLNNLQNNTINLYKKIDSIPSLLPNLKSIDEIDEEIELKIR